MANEKIEERQYQLIGPSDDGEVSDLLASLSSKDGKQRLQALIAEWLRMENLVVLAGAGTSVCAGGKTMTDLEREVLAVVKASPKIPNAVSGIVDARIGLIDESGAKVNFEEWLSFLANAKYLASVPNSPFDGVQWSGGFSPTQKEISWLVDTLGRVIFAECALPLADATGSVEAARDIPPQLAFLAKLVARDSNLGRAHLFTINYDTLFEQALEMLGIQYFDGFTGRADARFDPSVYGLDIYYPGEVSEGRVRRFDKFLHLYKLHGSIHWRTQDDEVRARHPDLEIVATYHKLQPAEKVKIIEQLASELPAAGILPTANKFSQTLTMPFAHLFRSFQIRLSAPQTFLLVLGYGFGDEHGTRIIETALMNPSLVMLVIEPNPQGGVIERVRRYKDLGKRAFVLTQTEASFKKKKYELASFQDFAHSIMPDVQWLDDFLRLRRFEREIQASGEMSSGGARDDRLS